jgi:hypothetical protein
VVTAVVQPRLSSTHLEQLYKLYILRYPDTMIPYYIKSAMRHSRAMLENANEGEVVAGSPALANVGEKVRALKM